MAMIRAARFRRCIILMDEIDGYPEFIATDRALSGQGWRNRRNLLHPYDGRRKNAAAHR
ncbi:hypothetical protein CCP2SC5_60047 [Azospirillaceae bacterium]